MKILLSIACILLAQVEVGTRAEADTLQVKVDPERMSYRVCLRARETVEYNSVYFIPAHLGMAPWGAIGYVRDESGKSITPDGGYSTAGFVSDTSGEEPVFKRVPLAGEVCSEWYRISDLLAGLYTYSKVPIGAWTQVRVGFLLTVRTGAGHVTTVSGESPWVDITPVARSVLSERP